MPSRSMYGSLSAPRATTSLKIPEKLSEIYAAVLAWMDGKNKCKVAGRTYAHLRDDGSIDVVLYETTIVTYRKNGDIVLCSDGHRTMTTKDMINMLLPPSWSVWTHVGVWYIGKGNRYEQNVLKPCAFADGVTIQKNGKITGAGSIKEAEKLARDVTKYVNDYMDALFAGKVPAPSGGDCWMCCLKTDDGTTLGEKAHDDHILGHITDKYYVPSLLARAVESFNVYDPDRNVLVLFWGDESNRARAAAYVREHDKARARKRLTVALRRYIKSQVWLGGTR